MSSLEPPNEYSSIFDAISHSTGTPFQVKGESSIGGGCINQTSKIKAVDGREFFVKQNDLSFLTFFQAEAKALLELSETGTIRVPKVITYGRTDSNSFLVLEYIQEGSSSGSSQKALGRQLAELHQIKQPYFGWTMDNCIGATPQPNPRSENWINFYRDSRLLHQFKLAKSKGKSFEHSERLLESIEYLFEDYSPHPSLLHGDLWGGNASCDTSGTPFIFDPATYYGDRETDLAFTYMFGGFSSSFYQSYQETYPLDDGFGRRKILYNLYHELNHYNLFGGGYAGSAQSSIHNLTSQLP
jgi:protein-ribulosamine 3-kinase